MEQSFSPNKVAAISGNLDQVVLVPQFRILGAIKLVDNFFRMSNILAATHNIDEDSLSALRRFCTNEVAAIGGKYSFEDAVKFQQG